MTDINDTIDNVFNKRLEAYHQRVKVVEEKKEESLICPLCKSINIQDESTYQNNGVMGSGYSSWKTSDLRSCKDCGIVFKPIKK